MLDNIYGFCASVFVLVFLAGMTKYFKNEKILRDFARARIIVFLAVIFNAIKLVYSF